MVLRTSIWLKALRAFTAIMKKALLLALVAAEKPDRNTDALVAKGPAAVKEALAGQLERRVALALDDRLDALLELPVLLSLW